MAPDILFANFCIRANDVIVTDDPIFDFSPCFNYVTISNLCVLNVAFDTKYVIVADSHCIIFFRCGFEHDYGSLFYDIVIPEDYFEILFLVIANDRTSGIDDAPLSKNDGAYDLVQS